MNFFAKKAQNFVFVYLDYIVIGSDSGRILILEYNGQKNTLEKARNVYFNNIFKRLLFS